MTPDEIRALAERIAGALAAQGWVPAPVRPEPPGAPTPGQLPPWAGAAQSLSDVAPGPKRVHPEGRHRPALGALTAAVRAAAAGTGPAPLVGGAREARGERGQGRVVSVAVSNRHIHATEEVVQALFGPGHRLTPDRPITQPGQFAARERVRVVGPDGAIENVRLVGPARDHTQVELAASDCRRIGVRAPIRGSGQVGGASGIRLEGPAGAVDLPEAAIVAARHLHLSPSDATRFGLTDGDRVDVELGSGDRRTVLPDVLVRAGPTHETELHVDVDEAHAFGVRDGCPARLVSRGRRRTAPGRGRRPLLTERDVAGLAADGLTLSPASPYLITPSARDRARALGIWRDS